MRRGAAPWARLLLCGWLMGLLVIPAPVLPCMARVALVPGTETSEEESSSSPSTQEEVIELALAAVGRSGRGDAPRVAQRVRPLLASSSSRLRCRARFLISADLVGRNGLGGPLRC